MRSCFFMWEDEGYVEVRRLLKERYGWSYKIVVVYVKCLIEGLLIKFEDGMVFE